MARGTTATARGALHGGAFARFALLVSFLSKGAEAGEKEGRVVDSFWS